MPLNQVAEKFGIPRGSFYRQMEYYKEGKDSKMNAVVKGFFDKLVMGKISTEEEFEKELNDIQFMMESQKESYKIQLDEMDGELRAARTRFRMDQAGMTSNQRIQAMEEMKRMESQIKDLCEKAGQEYDLAWDLPMQRRLVWNTGKIRSSAFCGSGHVRVVIDADYDRCRDITLDLLLEISGEDFPVGMFKAMPNTKIVDLDDVVEGPKYKYRLRWIEDQKVMMTESYPLMFEEY